jgi:hypothetical protein
MFQMLPLALCARHVFEDAAAPPVSVQAGQEQIGTMTKLS